MAEELLAAGEIWLRGILSARAALLLAGGMLTSWLAMSAALRQTSRRYTRHAFCGFVALGWLLAFLVGESETALVRPQESAFPQVADVPAHDLDRLPVDAVTDTERRIPVFSLSAASLERIAPSIKLRPDRQLGLQNWAIELAPADPTTNCHGWIFASGRCLILSEHVDDILADNGYREVDAPTDGDLVVYRSPIDNSIVHTGVVKTVTDDGIVLVESKWGLFGRFLHQPQHQSYSHTYRFLRSPRIGHELSGLAPLRSSPIASSPVRRRTANPF